LSSILGMDYPNFEVVVIDNGSTDGSEEFIRENFPKIHLLLNEKNLGYSRGFNRGLEYAFAQGADYFLIMNNDTVIHEHALSALVETALKNEKAGFVTGKVYFYDQPDVLQTVGKQEHPILWNGSHIGAGEKDNGQYDNVEERVFLDDVFTLVSRRLYEEVGGYSPQFFLEAEEYDWQARAKKKGWKFYYTPDAKLWHRVSMSMGGRGSLIAHYFDIRNTIIVMFLHRGILGFIRYYLWVSYHVTFDLITGLLAKLIKPSVRLKYYWAGFLGLCAGLFWIIHRRQVRCVPWLVRVLK
ncbi:glycosyltransferase family 2 protein, partial [Candidatus Poribacteria bacterium]|nr:glycosyltransferase family 2 protein [Candidatus Poribacteria bacterium]